MPGLWWQRHRSWQEYVWAPIFHPSLVFCIVGAILTIGGQFSTAHPSFIDFVSKEIPFFYICICWFLNLYCICFILFGGNLLAGHVFTDFYQVLVGSRASRSSHRSRFRGRGSVEALKKQLAPRLCTVYTQRSKSKKGTTASETISRTHIFNPPSLENIGDKKWSLFFWIWAPEGPLFARCKKILMSDVASLVYAQGGAMMARRSLNFRHGVVGQVRFSTRNIESYKNLEKKRWAMQESRQGVVSHIRFWASLFLPSLGPRAPISARRHVGCCRLHTSLQHGARLQHVPSWTTQWT